MCEGKLPLGLCAPQLCLLDTALRGAPVPDGNIQRGGNGRTQIGNSIRTVHGKLRCVNSVPIVEAQSGQIPAARASYLVTRLLHSRQRGSKIRIVPCGPLLQDRKSVV